MVLDQPTLEVCIEAINEKIITGKLSGDGTDETARRYGLILAHNILGDIQMRASRMPGRDLGCGKALEKATEKIDAERDMELVEAKLLGLWAPREGQKTDALFIQEGPRRMRQKQAADIEYHWRRLRELGFFTSARFIWRNA